MSRRINLQALHIPYCGHFLPQLISPVASVGENLTHKFSLHVKLHNGCGDLYRLGETKSGKIFIQYMNASFGENFGLVKYSCYTVL